LSIHAAALDFCIEWFDSNTKENFNIYLEIALEKFEKKKKMFSPLPLGFGPVLWPGLTFFGPAPPLLPSAQAARLLPSARGPLIPPRVPLWAEPSRRPNSRASAASPCCSLTSRPRPFFHRPVDPTCQASSSSSRQCQISSLLLPIRFDLLNPSLSFFSNASGL
jgi:hypothetical protein